MTHPLAYRSPEQVAHLEPRPPRWLGVVALILAVGLLAWLARVCGSESVGSQPRQVTKLVRSIADG